jgi:monoamine oxidase
MSAIALNSDGSIKVSFANGKTTTADHVILCMSFAVLRTLNYKKAGFDTLKQTAITQLGAGRNAKLNLQFTSRPWNASGSTGSLYSDKSFQSAWEVTRGQGGTTGILVEYPGANVAQSMGQSSPYTTTATNSQVTTYANQFLSQIEPIFPGITPSGTAKRCSPPPSPTRTSSAPTPTGSPASTPASAATKASARATSTSPENTAPPASRASWKAAPPKASALPTKSSPTSE